MNSESTAIQSCEISPRFRVAMEERIARLELDAVGDERALDGLQDEDHLRRHRGLVAVQRMEALRMRIFLDRARTRIPGKLFVV